MMQRGALVFCNDQCATTSTPKALRTIVEGCSEAAPLGGWHGRLRHLFIVLETALAIAALVMPVRAQESVMHAGMLAHALDRVATTGRVLYIGAHPDDENTRLLA